MSIITAMGSIPFTDFYQVIQYCHPDATDFSIWKLRRDLAGLGHIKLDFKARSIHACSPRLCLLPEPAPDGVRVVLAGARNNAIVKQFGVHPVFQRVQVQSQGNAYLIPDCLKLSGPFKELRAFARKTCQPSCAIGNDPNTPDAWVLLCGVAPLTDRLNEHSFSRKPAGAGNGSDLWEVFHPKNARFRPWSQIKKDYRWHLMLIRRSPYLHWLARRRLDGSWEYWQHGFEGDPLWAKWAVVHSSAEQNLMPESPSGQFIVPSWLPLPIELHRVCCLCTGMLPQEKDQNIIYKGVPAVIQAAVLKKLSIGNFLNSKET